MRTTAAPPRARTGKAALLALAMAGALPALPASADHDGGQGAGPHAVYYGEGCDTHALPRNDDGSTGIVSLTDAFPDGLNFFGTTYNSLYVNNNGNITFDGPMSTYTPFELLTTETPMIAPFFGDVDTRPAESDVVRYGTTRFEGHPAFCVLWAGVGVGYYSSGNKLNEFQLLLVNRSDTGAGDFDIVFNYDQIQWEAGNASGGTDGLGGSPARAGYSNGVDRSLELPGSAQAGAFLDSNAVTGLIHNLSGQGVSGAQQLGRYVFPVRNGETAGEGSINGAITSGDPAAAVSGATVSACGGDDPATGATEQICQVSTSNESGGYLLPGLPPGDYTVQVSPPGDLLPAQAVATVAGTTVTRNFHLETPVLPPAGTSVGGDSTSDGTPVVIMGAPFDISVPCPGDGTGQVRFFKNGTLLTVSHNDAETQSVTLAPDASGHLVAVGIALHTTGLAQVELTVSGCGRDGTSIFDIYIDPSGRILDQNGDPVAGATVTLLRSDTEDGTFTVVPDGSTIMSPANRTNPMPSGADGYYGWLTVPGFYIVRATPPANCVVPGGSDYVQSDILPVPPEQTGIDLVLECDTPKTLVLTPATATDPVDTSHTVTAAVTETGGPAVTSGNVLFTVTGAHPQTGTAALDGSGTASFTYTGTNAGADAIAACYDENGNSTCDAGEASGEATKTWTAASITATCNGLVATIVSSAGTVTGTAGDDVIVGGPLNQVINGLGGNDTICGGGGNDVLQGGAGNDFLDGQGGMDIVIGGTGNDIEHGGDLMDKVGGHSNDPGNDQLFGDGGSDQCFGTSGDTFHGSCEQQA